MIKFNKIPIFLIVCVFIITAAFGIWILISAEDDGSSHIAFEKLIAVNIYGTEGEGYVEVEINGDYIKNLKTGDGALIGDSLFDIEISKENNLSNGDSFTVSIANADDLKNQGIIVDKSSVTYKVSGLKEGVDFDIFADLKISIDDGQIVLDNSGCSNFVKDNVDFFIKNDTLSYKEGDTVMVGAYVDMNAATDNGYNIKVKEKEYILSEQESNQ